MGKKLESNFTNMVVVLFQTDQDAWDSVLSVALNNILPGCLCMKSPCGNKILR